MFGYQQLLFAFLPSLGLAGQLYASHYSGTINLLTHSGSSLTLTSSVKGCGAQPSFITWDPLERKVYCVDETTYGSGSVSEFTAATDGALTVGPKASAPGGGIGNTIYGGANGNGFMAVVHYQTSQFSTWKLPLTASSQALQTFKYTMSGRGANPSRQDAPHPHGVAADPTGTFLVVPDLGADLLRIYSIDKTSGKLTDCPAQATTPGTGPRHATFWVPASSSRVSSRQTAGTMMYTANELSNSVSAWSVTYSGSCPKLSWVQTLTPYAGNKTAVAGTKVAEVHIKGNTLTSSTRNDKAFSPNDSMTYYTLDAAGKLTYGATTSSYGTYPRTFSINKAGDFVAIGDQTTSNVAIVPRDPKTGVLGAQVATLRVATAGTPENEDGLSSVVWAD